MNARARGWTVVLAGTAINLALGVLYSWSVIGKALTRDWGWSASQASLAYSLAIGVFALTMVFAGRAQDKLGPRRVATAGGALTGAGLMVASFARADSPGLLLLGFGVLAGAGIGLGYAAATPAAVKWFPPRRKGLITGIVVSGFGLASVYIAPLTNWMLDTRGINGTLLWLGAAFLVVTAVLAQFLANPPTGYSPAEPAAAAGVPATAAARHEYDWHEMLHTSQFYLLWLAYAFAAFAGLMIIGHMAKIAGEQQPGVNLGFVLVAVLAIFNATGRVGAGLLSDRIGRVRTMMLVFAGQATVMVLFPMFHSTGSLLLGSALVGLNYGANLALFPSATADYFGTRNLGVNYGLVFTAWGMGGVFGGLVAGRIVDQTGSYRGAFWAAAALCVVAAGISAAIRAPGEHKPKPAHPAAA